MIRPSAGCAPSLHPKSHGNRCAAFAATAYLSRSKKAIKEKSRIRVKRDAGRDRQPVICRSARVLSITACHDHKASVGRQSKSHKAECPVAVRQRKNAQEDTCKALHLIRVSVPTSTQEKGAAEAQDSGSGREPPSASASAPYPLHHRHIGSFHPLTKSSRTSFADIVECDTEHDEGD